LHKFRFFFSNDSTTTDIYTLSLHDALPISLKKGEIILSFDSKKEAIQLQNLKIQIATQKQRVEQDRANEKQYEIALREKSADLKDRKSTRLNSSHVKISYAVFCLKKKKTRK